MKSRPYSSDVHRDAAGNFIECVGSRSTINKGWDGSQESWDKSLDVQAEGGCDRRHVCSIVKKSQLCMFPRSGAFPPGCAARTVCLRRKRVCVQILRKDRREERERQRTISSLRVPRPNLCELTAFNRAIRLKWCTHVATYTFLKSRPCGSSFRGLVLPLLSLKQKERHLPPTYSLYRHYPGY